MLSETTAAAIIGVSDKLIEAIIEDLKSIGISKAINIKLSSNGKPVWKYGSFTSKSGILKISSDEVSTDVAINPFNPSEKIWNGISCMPDSWTKAGTYASIYHDVIYSYADEIKEFTKDENFDVYDFADNILYTVWNNYQGSSFTSKIAYQAVKSFGKCYRWITGIFSIILISVLLCGCQAGCYSYPDWKLVDHDTISDSDIIDNGFDKGLSEKQDKATNLVNTVVNKLTDK